MTTSCTEETFQGRDGTTLWKRAWNADTEARATLAIVHGIGEHGGRYGTVVAACTRQNINVCALDLRGHGKSEGLRGHVDHWHQYRDDVSRFLGGIPEGSGKKHLFLMGHSFGALVALEYVIMKKPGLSGVVISGVPLEPAGVAGPVKVFLAKILSRVTPTFSLALGIAPEALSRDPAVAEMYRTDPLVFGKVTARWGAETLDAVERVRGRVSEIEMPLLVVHGEKDSVNLASGARELYETVGSSQKELYLDPGGFHEPHNDVNGAVVAGKIAEWVKVYADSRVGMC